MFLMLNSFLLPAGMKRNNLSTLDFQGFRVHVRVLK